MSFRYIKCSDIIDVRDGTHESPKYVLKGYPLITSKNIKDNRIDFDNVNFVCEEDFNKINMRSAVENGDILMPMIGTVGNPVLVDVENKFAIKNVALFKLSNNKEIDSKYFYYLLISDIVVRQLDNNKRGGTQSFVSLSNIRNLEIPSIHINMQKHIVNILDKVRSLIDKRKAQIEALDELIKSVFYDMFGDPVINNKGWNKRNFSEVVDKIDSGWSPKCDECGVLGNEWGVLKLSAVTSGSYKENENKRLPSGVEYKACNLVRKGDLLFTRKNTRQLVGATCYVFEANYNLMIPDIIFRLVTNGLVNRIFFWKLFSNEIFRQEIIALANGSSGSMPNISKTNLLKLSLIVPPIELQNKFANIVENIENQKELLQQSLTELENNFNCLMQKAFKGELFS